jgi:hypothetical protein
MRVAGMHQGFAGIVGRRSIVHWKFLRVKGQRYKIEGLVSDFLHWDLKDFKDFNVLKVPVPVKEKKRTGN